MGRWMAIGAGRGSEPKAPVVSGTGHAGESSGRQGRHRAPEGRPRRIEVREESVASLAEYARVPISFEARQVLDVVPAGGPSDAPILSPRDLDAPYVKDYDRLPGEGPLRWPDQFDLERWGFFSARDEERWVGAAAVAFDTPGVDLLERRGDLAVLWDLRVAPDLRGRSIGSRLFGAVVGWATARGCRTLRVETQNTNAPACEFYARQGCALVTARPLAYPELPQEVQLIWELDLRPDPAPPPHASGT